MSRHAYKILVQKHIGKWPLGRLRKWEKYFVVVTVGLGWNRLRIVFSSSL
jgi:hypothetical protein